MPDRKPLKFEDIPTLELEAFYVTARSDPNVNVHACYPNACPPYTTDPRADCPDAGGSV